jgi:hypothetical protein
MTAFLLSLIAGVISAVPGALTARMATENCKQIEWTQVGTGGWVASCSRPNPVGQTLVAVFLLRGSSMERLFRYERWQGDRASDEHELSFSASKLHFVHKARSADGHLYEELSFDLKVTPARLLEAREGGLDRCDFAGFASSNPSMALPDVSCGFHAGDSAPRCEAPYVGCDTKASGVGRTSFIGIPLLDEDKDPTGCMAKVGSFDAAAVDGRSADGDPEVRLVLRAHDGSPNLTEKPGTWKDHDHFEVWLGDDLDANICRGMESQQVCQSRLTTHPLRLVIARRKDGLFDFDGAQASELTAKADGERIIISMRGELRQRALGPLSVAYVDVDGTGHSQTSASSEVRSDRVETLGRLVRTRWCMAH